MTRASLAVRFSSSASSLGRLIITSWPASSAITSTAPPGDAAVHEHEGKHLHNLLAVACDRDGLGGTALPGQDDLVLGGGGGVDHDVHAVVVEIEDAGRPE
jgi:hypothetical protein